MSVEKEKGTIPSRQDYAPQDTPLSQSIIFVSIGIVLFLFSYFSIISYI